MNQLQDWTGIERHSYLEKDLQDVFTGRAAGDVPCSAGTPEWMSGWTRARRPMELTAYGIKAQGDACWTGPKGLMVAELKYAPKYEPLALATSILYAKLQSWNEKTDTYPLIVTQANLALRVAVNEIRRFTPTFPFGHVEVDLLGRRAGNRPEFIWMQDPHAKLVEDSENLSRFERTGLLNLPPTMRCWKAREANTWILANEVPSPPHFTGPCVFMSQFDDGKGWILWMGNLPYPDEYWEPSKWNRCGQYWILRGEKAHAPLCVRFPYGSSDSRAQ